MKKTISLITGVVFFTSMVLAQSGIYDKAKTNLEKNLNTVAELEKLLASDYTQLTDASSAVSAKNFKMGECMALTSFGDEAAQKQAETLQTEFNKMFGNSIWCFDKYDQYNQVLVAVKATSGQSEKVPYSAFPGSATFKISSLIQGLEIDAYIYQNKKDKTNHMIFFAAGNGMVIAAEFNITNEKATAKISGNNSEEKNEVNTNATEIKKPTTNQATQKAKLAVKGKLGKLL